MKKGMDLSEFLARVREIDGGKADHIVKGGDMRLAEGGTRLEVSGEGGRTAYDLAGLGQRQLGTRLGVPARFYDRMREEMPSVLVDTVNALLHGSGVSGEAEGAREESFLLRTVRPQDGRPRVRAVLTDSYNPLDDVEVLDAILEPLMGLEGLYVEACNVTPNGMEVKFVSRLVGGEVVPGDYVRAGIMVSNSEVGLGSLKVVPLIYRCVCSNGMCVEEAVGGATRRHIRTRRENPLLLEELREKAFATLSQEVLGHQIERLREAAGVPITGEDGHLPRIREVLGLTVQEADAVWEEFLSEGDLNAYGLGNAITKVSQGVEGFERATELEGIGWKATGMPWGRILW